MVVAGIGQCSWDYLAEVDSYPGADSKKEVLSWQEQGGGPVATALVALRRLGVECGFFGIVGDDGEGGNIRRSLLDEGVEVSGLLSRRGASSQTAFIAIERGKGTRTIFWRRPSARALLPEELPGDFLKGCNFLLLDGLMAEVSVRAAKKAREASVPVMLDAGRVREGMLEAAALSDYVVGSEEFGRELGWNGDPESFRPGAGKLTPGVTTITLGRRGSVTYSGGEIIEVPAFEVDVIDSTGAGDVFHGGYVYGLLRGWDLSRTVRFASAMAALKCRKLGGRAGIPDLEEVLRFMESRRGSGA
ncbi:MAG: PfkB family carbohydrate kinase [Nitrospirota bacterium]|jgi:sulfofructose kinase